MEVSYCTLRRCVQKELGVGGPRLTVWLADLPRGEGAQVDFGEVGWLVDSDGKRRKLLALIVTMSYWTPFPLPLDDMAPMSRHLPNAFYPAPGAAREGRLRHAGSAAGVFVEMAEDQSAE